MQEIAIMENMLEKNVGYTPKRKKKFGDPRSRRRPIEMHPKNLIRLTNEYEIVRNKKNRSTLNNIHAPRANIEEVN